MPDNDSTWSAEDARYSTVRWTPDPYAWAYGPSQTDPRSGEILNADIIVAAGFTTYYTQLHQEQITPDALLQMSGFGIMPQLAGMGAGRNQQVRVLQSARQTCADGLPAHRAGGHGYCSADAHLPEEFLGDGLRDLIMHEVGHTLGLRHNFRGSSQDSL